MAGNYLSGWETKEYANGLRLYVESACEWEEMDGNGEDEETAFWSKVAVTFALPYKGDGTREICMEFDTAVWAEKDWEGRHIVVDCATDDFPTALINGDEASKEPAKEMYAELEALCPAWQQFPEIREQIFRFLKEREAEILEWIDEAEKKAA